MRRAPAKTITKLLQNYNRDEPKAFDKLFDHVYEELYKIAKRKRRNWRGNNTLNTTAILHEAYIKLVDHSIPECQSKNHFLAAASKAMRHILINYARDQNRQKRGGDQKRVSITHLNLQANGKITLSEQQNEVLIELEEVLKLLEKENERMCRIVECRFFGGLTIKETADSLGVSPSTVKRGWKTAQLWIYRELLNALE